MLEEIKKISIFIVVAQMILNLSAGKQYQKYIKLLVSIMIMVQFILPILNFFKVCTQGEFWATVEQYEKEISKQVESVSKEYTAGVEDELNALTAEEVKRQILATEGGQYVSKLEYRMGRYRIRMKEMGTYGTKEWEEYFAALLGTERNNVEVMMDENEP